MNTRVTVSNVRHGATKTNIVVEVQRDVVDTHDVIFDIRRNMLRSQEGTDDQRRLVGDTQTVRTTECMLTVC